MGTPPLLGSCASALTYLHEAPKSPLWPGRSQNSGTHELLGVLGMYQPVGPMLTIGVLADIYNLRNWVVLPKRQSWSKYILLTPFALTSYTNHTVSWWRSKRLGYESVMFGIFFLHSSVKSLQTVTLQYVLRIAHLFFISVLQKRLFATIHFLTKYSDSSMKSVSHIVEPPTQLHLNVNEKLCLMLLNMLTSPRSPALVSHSAPATAQGTAWKTSWILLISDK